MIWARRGVGCAWDKWHTWSIRRAWETMGTGTDRRNKLIALPSTAGMGGKPRHTRGFWLGTTHISSLVYTTIVCYMDLQFLGERNPKNNLFWVTYLQNLWARLGVHAGSFLWWPGPTLLFESHLLTRFRSQSSGSSPRQSGSFVLMWRVCLF